jgi:hypothetical protein
MRRIEGREGKGECLMTVSDVYSITSSDQHNSLFCSGLFSSALFCSVLISSVWILDL